MYVINSMDITVDYTFLTILIVILLVCVISIYAKSKTKIQIGISAIITIVVLGVGIGTYFLGSKVNMLSMTAVLFIMVYTIMIMLIVNNSKKNDDVNESFTTLPTGYKEQDGQFTPSFVSCVKNAGVDSEKERSLEERIDNARASCSKLDSLEEELMKYQDDDGGVGNMVQGPCRYSDTEMGIRLLSKGNVCLPLNEVYKKVSTEETTSNNKKVSEENLNKCMSYLKGNSDQTACYARNSDFEKICQKDFGQAFGVSKLEKCPSPFNNKWRATCKEGAIDGVTLDDGELHTKCYDFYTKLDKACQMKARDEGLDRFTTYGVKKYMVCSNDRNTRRAICAKGYINELPTRPPNTTKCIRANTPNLTYQFLKECGCQGENLVPINIAPYDCEFGELRAQCVSKEVYDKIKNRDRFYEENYA